MIHNRRFRLCAAAWTLLLLSLAWAPAAGQAPDAPVVARVNGVAITAARYTSAYAEHLMRAGGNDTPGARRAFLDHLIDSYLLAEEARRRGLDDEAYEAYVTCLTKLAVGGRYIEVAFADSVPPPTDADVRLAFARGKEQVILRQLFFRTPEAAARAHRRLEEGEDFVVLANAYSGAVAFDSLAGYLGAAGYWDLDDAVAGAVFALPVGQYTEPVRSRYGWHILRMEGRARNPLLTESEYAYRREGVEGLVRSRRFT